MLKMESTEATREESYKETPKNGNIIKGRKLQLTLFSSEGKLNKTSSRMEKIEELNMETQKQMKKDLEEESIKLKKNLRKIGEVITERKIEHEIGEIKDITNEIKIQEEDEYTRRDSIKDIVGNAMKEVLKEKMNEIIEENMKEMRKEIRKNISIYAEKLRSERENENFKLKKDILQLEDRIVKMENKLLMVDKINKLNDDKIKLEMSLIRTKLGAIKNENKNDNKNVNDYERINKIVTGSKNLRI
ncbi:hypothetical protein M0802_009099 [Mischocyttarus mexicanus]|nr:hypothetical protein M0802_009099 [Mischocyttarus mexicanus]